MSVLFVMLGVALLKFVNVTGSSPGRLIVELICVLLIYFDLMS